MIIYYYYSLLNKLEGSAIEVCSRVLRNTLLLIMLLLPLKAMSAHEIPSIASVTADCSNYFSVTINFTGNISNALGSDPANFSITGGVTPVNVLAANRNTNSTVTLTTTAMTPNVTYTLNTLQPLFQNVNFSISTTTVKNVGDQFDSPAYNNNDGSLNWATDWLEINEFDGAQAGDVQIRKDSGDDRLSVGNGNKGLQREVDLFSFTQATLSFDYRRRQLNDVNEYVDLDISADGGSTWVNLARFAGPANDGGYQTVSYDISAYRAANTRIRFLSSAALGNNDEIFFDNVDIRGTVPILNPACVQVDHFAIQHDGAAVNCQAEPVILRAHQLDHSDEASYADTVTLSTSTANGDWSLAVGNGPFVPGAADSGAASYTFVPADNGVVQLLLKNTHPETLTINVIDTSGVTETSGVALASEDQNLVFSATGFRFIDGADVAAIGTQIAGKDSSLAPNAQTLYLQAVRTSDDGVSCTGVFADTTVVNVDLGSSCVNPGSCLAGQRVNVSNNATTTAIANPQNQDAGPSNYTSVPLLFTTNSRAPLVLNYRDAGEIQLHARYNIPLDSGAPSGNLMSGNSNAFVVRPFGIELDFSGDRATNGISGVSYAADANGSAFQIAGQVFDASLRAVTWNSVDDTDSNGVPDACADLSDNTGTANFGKETIAVTPADALLTQTLFAPATGVVGTLTTSANSVAFVNGVGTKSIAWDEVGIINLDATVNNYLASSQNVQGNACNVGRFYPNNFVLANPVLSNRSDILACPDTFSYMEENFNITFDLRAMNALAAPAVTRNYFGTFAKLDPASLVQMNYGAADTGTNLTARLSVASSGAFSAGIASVSATQALSRNATPDGAYANFQVGIAPVDSDLVSLLPADLNLSLSGGPNTHGLLDQTALRYGRLSSQNNFGSELSPLTLPLTAEYYLNTTAEFVTNTDDSCTVIALADVLLYNDQEVKSGRVLGSPTIAVNGAASTTLTGISAFLGGVSSMSFTAPNAEGYVDVEVQTPFYLRSDLDGIDQGPAGPGAHCIPSLAGTGDPADINPCTADGNLIDDVPMSRASFGIFKGSNKVIYIREVY